MSYTAPLIKRLALVIAELFLVPGCTKPPDKLPVRPVLRVAIADSGAKANAVLPHLSQVRFDSLGLARERRWKGFGSAISMWVCLQQTLRTWRTRVNSILALLHSNSCEVWLLLVLVPFT